MDRTTGRAAFRAARDILVRYRDDYDAAVAAFRWPDVGDQFNWALDWFDPVAANNPRTALRIIDEDGSDCSYSFAEIWAPDQATADAIFAHAHRNLAPYQRIRRIEFMELPKTISGKIRRVDLRARENSCEPDDLVGEYRDREPVSIRRPCGGCRPVPAAPSSRDHAVLRSVSFIAVGLSPGQ